MSELYKLPDGWEWKKISDTFKIKSGDFLPKKTMVESGNYNVYGGNGINGKHNEYNLSGENIIIGRVGALCGNVRFVKEDIWITDNAFYVSEYKKEINKQFLTQFLSYIDLGKTANQAAQPVISYKSISQVYIPLPPLQEQKRIITKLDTLFEKIDKAIALHQKNMDEADAFMGSVLNEVFGELEERYENHQLGSLTKTTSGGTPKRNEKSYWGGSIGWLKSGELNDGYITEVEEFITEDGLNKSSAKLFPEGTLLIAMYGATVGRLGILNIETTTNQAICAILNDKNKFETLYMFYFLKKIREKMLKDSFGGAQPNISQTYIKELEVPLPPLDIQQKVVSYLDEISQKIEKVKAVQKEKMESLKALKASILDQAFRGEL
ncbi:restriction endonuclease subunit S [Sulfurovum sp.]|jgi:type I restriction enzyme S subunit|uniref:restriction endonuclease subunit S n=1 Tax=Sulfurovum sp. TaxID=1969726 RepID=UPI002A361FA4|nr:restriction endonuclease subunit S [Sulfurovum sp.]MDD2451247.1 restriction endonuclease subunit S [Sulfurovum sp.]MDY0403433.1 restriction endonuclease subunit S [Sulfurovum sp.]